MGKNIDRQEILQDALLYSIENDLTNEEKNELFFICNAFVKYYNDNKDLKINDLFYSFDRSLINILKVNRWSGLITSANLLYKEIPKIKELLCER